ncbi:MAG: exodeoxyribonuclease VII large subunit [Acidobacteriota bacterium]
MSQQSFLQLLMQDRRPLSVSELTAEIKILIEGQFLDVWVEGEISNFRRHSSGHWYFTLKDEGAYLRAASFRMQNRLIRFTPQDGLMVRARGRLSVYEARGEYQMLVDYLEPAGAGALQSAFEELKARLAAEGLFDAERKRALPLLPRRIGVVTSPTGAAIRDILRVLRRRNEAVSVLVAPARVQGEGAAREIADAIRALNHEEDIDVIIVGRGGGSAEDLACFNDEEVARAIFNSLAPVISAVGHETDFTIADFVADLRASTPSAAAEMVSLARTEALSRIDALLEDLAHAVRYLLIDRQNRLSELVSSRAFRQTASRIHAFRQRFDFAVYSIESAARKRIRAARLRSDAASISLRETDIRRRLAATRGRLAVLSTRLVGSSRGELDRQSEKFAVLAGKLAELSPLGVLSRGYSIAFDSGGRIIKRAEDVKAGERVRVRLSEGEIDCTRN